jgi:protein-tyrosine phosphatase
MEHVFWLIEGRLAGRPGPDREPWDLEDLRSLGIDALLTLNEGEGFEASEAAARGLHYHCARLPPNAPPLEGDEEICLAALPAAYDFVHDQHASGRAVLAHCTAGKDRTGLFMTYFLIREYGIGIDAAIERVRAVRPEAISAPGWDELARRVLEKLSLES